MRNDGMTGLASHSVAGQLLKTTELPAPPATCCRVASPAEDPPRSSNAAVGPVASAASATTIERGLDAHKESVTIR